MDLQKIALVGNPNSGKSSVFNQLTGMNQHVGNYPGITVDKKFGNLKVSKDRKIEVIDLPGTYSIYPRSEDEKIVYDLLTNPEHEDYPDAVVVVIDSTNLERSLLLFTQIYDLKIPVVLVLNMMDILAKNKTEINLEKLSEMFGDVDVVGVNSRSGEGIDELKTRLANFRNPEKHFAFLSPDSIQSNGQDTDENRQVNETALRYERIRKVLNFVVKKPQIERKSFSLLVDKIVVHPIAGYVIFVGILFMIFQTIYSVAEIPMNLIDGVFFTMSQWVKQSLPEGIFNNLLAEGIIPGLGGIIIFIPQIVLLFTFIIVLEETGYMSRVVFIMDRLMRPLGLNGKSVVPLISGVACAIPAIMATRTIHHWKDRLITIMVIPLMSCSARLPVYTLLIALVVPDVLIFNIFNLKGLVLLGLYFLGLIAALVVATIFKFIVKAKTRSFLVLELPKYKVPHLRNIALGLWEKASLFVWEAGKVIMAISVILWVLASYGPAGKMEQAVSEVPLPAEATVEMKKAYEHEINSVRLEHSWIGTFGKVIEPVIEPLGYDWKMGISLITSFAAREVFVGSMATIYSVGEDFEDGKSLLDRMRSEINPKTGLPVYTFASGISLMIFYAFAMQCMSTLAIVRQETKSWKWPMIQLIYMTIMAYLGALMAYQILS